MGSLNSKRVLLLVMGGVGLVAAVVCAIVLASGALEATRGRIFLMGSLFIVSLACLGIAFVFKGQAAQVEEDIRKARYQRPAAAADPDQAPLPQNAPANQVAPAAQGEVDIDNAPLPQNSGSGRAES